MKRGKKTEVGSMAAILVLAALLFTPSVSAEAAATRAAVTAEVVEAASVHFPDSSAPSGKMAAASKSSGESSVNQPKPQVEVVVIDGITFVTIDYQ